MGWVIQQALLAGPPSLGSLLGLEVSVSQRRVWVSYPEGQEFIPWKRKGTAGLQAHFLPILLVRN